MDIGSVTSMAWVINARRCHLNGSAVIVWENQWFIVAHTVQDMQDDQLVRLDAVEDQVVADGTAADAMLLIARHERKGSWRIGEGQRGGT